MVVIAANHFSAYQLRKLTALLKQLQLQTTFTDLPVPGLVELQDQDTLMVIISAKAASEAKRLIKFSPWLQLLTITKNIDEVLGLTLVADWPLMLKPPPERLQLKQALIDYARRQRPDQTAAELVILPTEVLLTGGQVLLDWLDRHQEAQLVICQLTDTITLGIYQNEVLGWYPLEFTRQEVGTLANLMNDLSCQIIAVKDEAGLQHQLHVPS
jgi:hypothetical protein